MSKNISVAILGGGCFWCLEPLLLALRGVNDVEPGYCGGWLQNPAYEQVCRGDTGHVEVVRVEFDAARISYETLLEIFFAIHDPTTQDRQGNDVGPQYASVIFYLNESQHRKAISVRDAVQAELGSPVCTRIEEAGTFWPAEAGHKGYFQNNPTQGYCRLVIAPKMAKFRQAYASMLA